MLKHALLPCPAGVPRGAVGQPKPNTPAGVCTAAASTHLADVCGPQQPACVAAWQHLLQGLQGAGLCGCSAAGYHPQHRVS
jgi:hypothetical protein